MPFFVARRFWLWTGKVLFEQQLLNGFVPGPFSVESLKSTLDQYRHLTYIFYQSWSFNLETYQILSATVNCNLLNDRSQGTTGSCPLKPSPTSELSVIPKWLLTLLSLLQIMGGHYGINITSRSLFPNL
jgi:hypothetical protein